RLEERLRRQPYVISSRGDVAATLRASTAAIQATTALIAAISLFVGAFLIFNTLSMNVVERAREIALLRAAGALRRQLYSLVLLQALVLGLVGAAFGVILGWLLAVWIGANFGGQAGGPGSLPIGRPALDP